MTTQHNIHYIELISDNLEKTKQFYNSCFAWTFTDWGPSYIAIDNAGIDGGFELGEVTQGSTLVILHSGNLEQSLQTVSENGGEICKDIFSFPGGRRFHFKDPSGNELAIWSSTEKVQSVGNEV